jgi:tetratricopeptide (TPR) repeat protein
MNRTIAISEMLEHAGCVLLPAGDSEAVPRISVDALAAAPPPEGARLWTLPCAFAQGGPWAGVRELFRSLFAVIDEAARELIARHDYELVHVLPELRPQLRVRHPCLTDTASSDERVRNYPADRAFRIVHGLIDLLSSFKERYHAEDTWILICVGYDEAGEMALCFFRELMRRRGLPLRLVLVPLCSPPKPVRSEGFASPCGELPFVLEPRVEKEPSAAEAARQAELIEADMTEDILARTAKLPDLVHLWRLAGRDDKLLLWSYRALVSFNTLGFYADAIRYGEAARRLLAKSSFGLNRKVLHWGTFFKLFMSYLGIGATAEALKLAEEEGLAAGENSDEKARVVLYYLLAMLHARYMAVRDLPLGERYLQQGLESLERAGLPDDEYWFQLVFNRNGLAMIRSFEGRHQEALDLCVQGLALLDEHLGSDRHRLHRSVLIYNMAQVHTHIGALEEAIEYYTKAIQMDPNYSEYYNERGNLLLKLGRLDEATRDYLQAIELSPPYFEVWTNLGNCHRLSGRFEEAITAYSRALDLSPAQAGTLLCRAQSREALGQLEAAVDDYGAALQCDPRLWQACAGRAVLLYELGRLPESVADLDCAISIAPEEAELYSNRAVALADLMRSAAARRDLLTYLKLRPDAGDRAEIEQRLRALDGAVSQPAVATAL